MFILSSTVSDRVEVIFVNLMKYEPFIADSAVVCFYLLTYIAVRVRWRMWLSKRGFKTLRYVIISSLGNRLMKNVTIVSWTPALCDLICKYCQLAMQRRLEKKYHWRLSFIMFDSSVLISIINVLLVVSSAFKIFKHWQIITQRYEL